MSKTCLSCNNLFVKNAKYSKTQWKEAIFCSRNCFGNYRKSTNWTHSQETRTKLSIAHTGTKKPWSGKYKHSPKQKENKRKIMKKLYGKRPDLMRKIKILHTLRKTKPKKIHTPEEITRKKKLRAFLQRRREYRKKTSYGNHSFREWEMLKKNYGFRCLHCKKIEPEIKLTEDHIIPLSLGGSNNINNIQPLCLICNMKKGTRVIPQEIFG